MGVVSGPVMAVSFKVLDRLSGSTILKRMNPMANTPVEYPNTNSERSNQLPLFMAGPKYMSVSTTSTMPQSRSSRSGTAYFTITEIWMEAIPKNTR